MVNTITVQQLGDPNFMYWVHQHVQKLKAKQLIHRASILQRDIENMAFFLPETIRYGHRHWLWYEIKSVPKSRHEVIVWEYFNSTRVFLECEHMPVMGLSKSRQTGIYSALEVLQDIMKNEEPDAQPFTIDGFTVTDQSSGVYYIMHVSMQRKGVRHRAEFVADIFLPFQGAGMGMYQKFEDLSRTTVNIIVGVTQKTDMSNFLDMYEKVCLQPSLHQIQLHVVLFGECKKTKARVDMLHRLYTRRSVTTYDSPTKSFSYASAYNHVASKLDDTELMVLLDHNLVFTAEFLDHCRMNAIRGTQVFFPMLFSFYNPELVHPHSPQMLISADTGFFLHYNYQVVAIYKSDYKQVFSFGMNQGDVQLVDKVLSSNLHVMRALEPNLRRLYKPRSCKELTGTARLDCMNSRADAIGSKKSLGSYLIAHKMLENM